MLAQRLVSLFRRYAATHLRLTLPGQPLLDDAGQMVGQIDRVRIQGTRLIAEGWTAAPAVTLTIGTARADCIPSLPRADVGRAHPALAAARTGFAIDLPAGLGAASLSLAYPDRRLIYPLPLPDAAALRRARRRLYPAFLRDLARATPVFLHWFATRDPADRALVKRLLRLTEVAAPQSLQRLLFTEDSLAALPKAARSAELARLVPAALARQRITIILPVYNAFDLLPDVLGRIAAHTDLHWHLIVVDDASTNPALRPFLRDWAADQNAAHPRHVTLIENAQNQGFIGSVNTALRLALTLGQDVVLLNSDAFVPKGWASRLMRPFLMHDDVATVTPLSNDAEILTMPVICRRIPLYPGEGDALDTIARRFHPDAGLVDAPTGVGFCMAMSLAYLKRLPALDTAFGRGYGEEVDWCRKVRAMGGRHLGLSNLFVEHRGGTSFGSVEKQRLIQTNNAIVSQRHPGFDAEVQAFIRADPLATPRLALGIAFAAGRVRGHMPIYLAHSLGGGAADCLAARIATDLGVDGPGAVIVLRVGGRLRWQVELHLPHGVTRGETGDFAFVQRLLDPVTARAIVYSCGVGDPTAADLPDRLLALARNHDRIEVLFHDYLPISPSYTLLDADDRHRGLPDPDTTDPAHRHRAPDGRETPLRHWQRAWGRLITDADTVTVFSQDSRRLVLAAYPQAAPRLRLRPHPMLAAVPRCQPRPGQRPVIGVLGNIGRQKGAAVLAALSRRLAETSIADLVVIGNLDPAFSLAPQTTLHGDYCRADIAALVAHYGIDRWLIPSIWPETFSYTTREALATGLPVWCFDLGAQADAVRAANGHGGVLPLTDGKPDLDAMIAALTTRRPARRRESASA